jgi:hypothetical protein
MFSGLSCIGKERRFIECFFVVMDDNGLSQGEGRLYAWVHGAYRHGSLLFVQ